MLGFNAAKKGLLWAGFATAQRHNVSDEEHARAALDWLVFAAKQGGGGMAHSLHFARGWLPAYPETTGYIIPTMLFAARRFDAPEAEAAAMLAWHWLCDIQQDDGGFLDLSGERRVFDTGQILIGINLLCSLDVPEAAQVATRSVGWLINQQESDGSFIRGSYNNLPHAYYARVGAALFESGLRLGLPEACTAGLLNLEWTLAQQAANGWFDHMSFAGYPPYSHTIVYTLEGLLAGYRLSGDQRMLEAVVKFSHTLREQIAVDGGVIRSQYNERFIAVNEQICVTGLCQWAAHCFRLARLGLNDFAAEGRRSLEVAKSLQLNSPLRALHGALPGSVPLSGSYMRFALPNWGVKFFLDALLEASEVDLPILI